MRPKGQIQYAYLSFLPSLLGRGHDFETFWRTRTRKTVSAQVFNTYIILEHIYMQTLERNINAKFK